MSWITQSVTGRLSQIGGQLKDILTESTEDIVDPVNELKVANERLKEHERHIEMLKNESIRWQEEASESNVKCKTYEAQLEQKQLEFKQIVSQKDAQINEFQKQINLNQNVATSSSSLIDSGFQKSALMEEFEEIPQSEFSEYIHLQKELKRLNEDNLHLVNENRQLINRIKHLEETTSLKDTTSFDQTQKELENTIANLKKEIFSLTNSNDRHQEEVIAIQTSYTDRIRSLTNEIENLKSQKEITSKTSSNKSDDGWCLNGDEINLDLIEKSESRQIESPVVIETSDEVLNLRKQIEILENDLDQANSTIQQLKNKPGKKVTKSTTTTSSTQTETYHEKNLKHKQEIDSLSSELDNVRKENELANERIQNILNETKLSENLLKQTNQDQEKQIDSLQLELKQLQQSINQEKLIQIKEHNEERQEIDNLKQENQDLKVKLDEKLNEIKLLGDQINDLNFNINCLKTADNNLSNELQQKTNLFLAELDNSNKKIASLESEKEHWNEQRKQFEFVLEEKTREASQLKNDNQKHLQHLSAQSKAIEKLQTDLKESSNVKTEKDDTSDPGDDVEFLKQRYNEIYGYLEQKNVESLNYYNEIQRLNLVISDSNRELHTVKTYNESLSEQYENLVKEFNIEQKMVDDLNQHIVDLSQQTSELNKTVISDNNQLNIDFNDQDYQEESIDREPFKREEVEEDDFNKLIESEEKHKKIIEQMQFQLKQLIEEKETLTNQSNSILNEHQTQIDQMRSQIKQLKDDKETLINQNNDQQTARINHLKDEKENIINQQTAQLDQMQIQISQLLEEKESLINQTNFKLNELNSRFNEQHHTIVNELKQQINQLIDEKELLKTQSTTSLNEISLKLNETVAYYENQLKPLNETSSKETQRNQQMSKELERLREHLVEMSDSYNKDAILAEEREKQLRLALTDAQKRLEQFDANNETSSKELEHKLESLSQTNQELKTEKDKLKERLKKADESLSHQTKVTKNLELVLERLQNDKDGQHTIEIAKYQQNIKEYSNQISNLKKEAICYQDEIESLKESLEAASLLELELNKKDDSIKQLNAQIGTKDALIESLDKRVNEIQKVNDGFIEKEMIKNLIIGYIKVTQAQERKQVLKLISTMLNFTQLELDQIENAGESKWFGFAKASPNPKTGPNKLITSDSAANKSFTELLIQYVDRESKPRPSLSFDLNSSVNSPSTNKKTDSPEKLISSNSSILLSNQNSASAVRFFNNSLIAPSLNMNNSDLNLINRNQSTASDSTASTVVKTDSPGNAFLEQILK